MQIIKIRIGKLLKVKSRLKTLVLHKLKKGHIIYIPIADTGIILRNITQLRHQ